MAGNVVATAQAFFHARKPIPCDFGLISEAGAGRSHWSFQDSKFAPGHVTIPRDRRGASQFFDGFGGRLASGDVNWG